MNVKDQSSRVKSRLRAAFFLGQFDEQQVYLMKSKEGNYKVGISKSPADRRKSLQTAAGTPIELVAAWRVMDKATLVEAHIHRKFKFARLLGEWFDGLHISTELVEQTLPCQFERVEMY